MNLFNYNVTFKFRGLLKSILDKIQPYLKEDHFEKYCIFKMCSKLINQYSFKAKNIYELFLKLILLEKSSNLQIKSSPKKTLYSKCCSGDK